MIKTVLKVSLLIVLLGTLIWIGFYSGVIKIAPKNVSFNQERSAILNRLNAMGNIELVNYSSNKIIKDTLTRSAKTDSSLKIRKEILLSINFEASACVSLNTVAKKDISQQDSSITVLLPSPTICNTKINNDSLKIYNSDLTVKDLDPKIINNADNQINALINSEVFSSEIINKAKTNLKKILLPVLKGATDKALKFIFK